MINIILATYNEVENIVPMLNMLQLTLKKLKVPYSIILIDDNSPDQTAKIAKSLPIKNLKVIERVGKLGLGSAYIEGLKYCNYKYTIIMDSDLQHDPFIIHTMFKIAMSCEDYDIVTATRYAKTGMVCNWPFRRKFHSMFSNYFARNILGLSSSDLTGSFRCYKTSFLKEVVPKIICKNFGFQMEIIARAEKMNRKIAEVPIVFYDRVFGESKMCFGEIYNFFKTVLLMYFMI